MKQLHEAAQSHAGLAAMRRWQEWSIIVRALRTNEAQLLALIEAPSQDEDLAVELIQNVRQTGVAEAYFAELYRLLHNYLASVKTLVDHSRQLLRRYETSSFEKEYQTRVTELRRKPVVAFIQDLRNVLLHQQLPAISLNLSIGTAQASQEFTLRFDSGALLSIERFTKPAKDYVLSRETDSWAVRTPVDEYGALVGDLCDWITGQFESQHGDEIEDYNRIVAEIHRMMPPIPTAEELAEARARWDQEPTDEEGAPNQESR